MQIITILLQYLIIKHDIISVNIFYFLMVNIDTNGYYIDKI